MLPKNKTKQKKYIERLSNLAKQRIGNLNPNYGKFKINLSYDKLYDLYHNKKMTMKQIAIMFSVTPTTIFDYLRRLGIKTRKTGYEKASKETKLKMSRARMGKKESLITRKRKSKSLKRAYMEGRHPQWKNGSTAKNIKIRQSLKYKIWRKSVFERDNYTCKKCGSRNGNGKKIYLEAHHIKSFANYPESRFELDNGLTLCRICHDKTKKKKI